jgi:DNA-binding transcriptional regulator/RsmH inhibitor MraZ
LDDLPRPAPHWGEYERAVDEKGRIILPPVVRVALGGAFVISCQEGPSLRLTPTAFDEPDSLQTDPQGRVRLRSFYRRWAGLESRDRVVLVALGDCLEFWRKETWTWFIKKNGQFEFDLDPHIARSGRRKD